MRCERCLHWDRSQCELSLNFEGDKCLLFTKNPMSCYLRMKKELEELEVIGGEQTVCSDIFEA